MSGETNILVVEDDSILRTLIKAHLEAVGYRVAVAADGAEALETVGLVRPDALVTDVVLPRVDGFRLLAKLRERPDTSNIPVVVLTGLDDESSHRRLSALGARAILVKPFIRDSLLKALAYAMHPQANVRADSSNTTSDLSRRHGAVMVCRLVEFTALCDRLGPDLANELLAEYYTRAATIISEQEGELLSAANEDVIAVFEPRRGVGSRHFGQAVMAALRFSQCFRELREWIKSRASSPAAATSFVGSVAVGVGTLRVARTEDGPKPEGAALDEVSAMQKWGAAHGWSVTVSTPVRTEVGPTFEMSDPRQALQIDDPVQVEIHCVRGLVDKGADFGILPWVAEDLRTSLAENAIGLVRNRRAAPPSKAWVDRRKGQVINVPGYTILRKLGEGGMSEVFLAKMQSQADPVALKILDFDFREDDDRLQRFIQEFALVSQIRHPRVARIYDQGFTEQHAYIAMEYFAGGDLRALIRQGLSNERAVHYLAQIAQALDGIHSFGIIHRDLKPDNLMCRTDMSLALVDFGIATQFVSDLSSSTTGSIAGTPFYVSPERISGEPTDHRADLYALGVIFYEMIAGVKPYEASSVAALLDMHVMAPLPKLPPSAARYQFVIDRLMAKHPDDRFITATELLLALEEVAAVQGV